MAAYTMALERYDRHVPFFTGAVDLPKGLEIQPLEVGIDHTHRDGRDRHERMIRDHEFDICELSFSSYIMATDRGSDFTATPVFPRRLFSQNHIYVRTDAGINSAADLAGRKVALRAFQTTMSVLVKGDLKFFYNVRWEDIHWVMEAVEAVPWTPPQDVSVEWLADGQRGVDLLLAGDVDAMIFPHPPRELLDAGSAVRRLFSDPLAEAKRYYDTLGYFPIMHIMAFRNEVVDADPNLPRALIDIWEDAKRLASHYYEDPGYSKIAFARNALETQETTFGPDIWPSGFAANRDNIARFIEYSADQGLISAAYEPEQLFHASVLDT
ncbi:MAG: taurine ABC transporter substrate-binding protein [Pseudomonadota bacterium]|nr:taurine ABC transporter substrate-binding protein [Pseudomonadota bacterium]